jgi:hypothetical protein
VSLDSDFEVDPCLFLELLVQVEEVLKVTVVLLEHAESDPLVRRGGLGEVERSLSLRAGFGAGCGLGWFRCACCWRACLRRRCLAVVSAAAGRENASDRNACTEESCFS